MTDTFNPARIVRPLVFEGRRNNMWAAQFGYEIGWNGEGDWFRVKLNGRNICKKIGGFSRAVEWATDHNTARILAMLDLEAVRGLVEAARGMKRIVEEIDGAMNHGAWRDEKSGMRLKDTPEWVALYNALAKLTGVM
jgi:hypothetical protein